MAGLLDYRKHPDLFADMQIPPHQQRVFIQLWHRHPNMPIVELSRQSKLSRPTCYKLIKKLRNRGDVRGIQCDDKPVSESVQVASGEVQVSDLSYFRRTDLIKRIGVLEEYVLASVKLLARSDRDFLRVLDAEEFDLNKVLALVERKLDTPSRLPSRNANPNVNPRYLHLT